MHEDSHQDEWSLETLAIRAGHHRTFEQEHSEPIFPTSSFVYESAAEAARKLVVKSQAMFTRALRTLPYILSSAV